MTAELRSAGLGNDDALRQTVLAQVRWGFHDSIGCYLALDGASTAALRAART